MFLQKKTYHIYMFCIVGKRDAFFKTQMVKKHVSREVFIKYYYWGNTNGTVQGK